MLRLREGVLAVDHPLDAAQRRQEPLEGPLVGELGMVVKNVRRPSTCAWVSIARSLPRNRRASTFTCTRKFEGDEIIAVLSAGILAMIPRFTEHRAQTVPRALAHRGCRRV
jgi:hypothetical protein